MDLRHRRHRQGCRLRRVLKAGSGFRHLRELHQNPVPVAQSRLRQDHHERDEQTTSALLVVPERVVVQPLVHVDQVAQVVRVDRVVHLLVLTALAAQVAGPVVDLEALEVDLNSDEEESRSDGDVNKKNCSHKRWPPTPRLTPQSPRVKLSSKEVQRLKK